METKPLDELWQNCVKLGGAPVAIRFWAQRIWQLNLEAAEAYRTGHPFAAESILEIADAAEEAWLRAEGVEINN